MCVAETSLAAAAVEAAGLDLQQETAPVQQEQQQHDDADDVRGADSPGWKTLQSCKMQGKMTLLQLPDGDITICSATSTQSLGMFGGVNQSAVRRRLWKALTVTEIKHY